MKIDRRCFLSLGVGAAAGITLSPLPWKLTDDLSIWTQMWPWTPVPPDGEVSYVNSACTLCSGGCGITVRKIANRAVKIEGREGHPINNGGICILGLAGLQTLYGPTRVKTPLRRDGSRGGNQWKEISWDEAVSEISLKLKEMRSNGASHTAACISGSKSGAVPELLKRFLTAYGSPNFMWMPTMQDTYSMLLKMMQGVDAAVGFDVENAGYILSFGSGVLEGWLSPVRMIRANSIWKENKVPLIQFEPRLSNTAAKSDKWYPINPGTEAVLALGIAHVIIKEALYKKEFIHNHVFGFENWKDGEGKTQKGFRQIVIETYSPEFTAGITGVAAEDIIAIAKDFAQASKPLAICGRGKGEVPGSFHEFMAVHALNALVGNLNNEGGVYAVTEPDYFKWAEVTKDEAAEKGTAQPRIDGAGSKHYPFAKSLVNRFIKEVESGNASVGALFVYGANPTYSLPDSKSVANAFSKIPFIVSFATHMDETAMQSDLILPVHSYLEGYEVVSDAAGYPLPLLNITKPVVKPLFNTKHAGDIIIQLANAIGDSVAGAFTWESYEQCLTETFGDNWEKLNEEGFIADTGYSFPSWDTAFRGTPTNLFEFFSPACKLPVTDESSDSVPFFKLASLEGNDREFPLLLIPYDTIRLSSGPVGNPPFLTKTVEDTILKGNDLVVEVNPSTGRKYGLADKKYAVLKTPKGSVKVKVNFFEGIMPDIVAVPRGLGHTAFDKYLAGKGVNVNELLGTAEDPVSGLDASWGSRAALSRG